MISEVYKQHYLEVKMLSALFGETTEMPKEGIKILKYIQDQKSIKTTFIIYSVTESLLEKNAHMHKLSIKQTYCMWLFNIYTVCI